MVTGTRSVAAETEGRGWTAFMNIEEAKLKIHAMPGLWQGEGERGASLTPGLWPKQMDEKHAIARNRAHRP